MQKSTLTVNIVGDSITHGLNHCTPEETYTANFSRMLAEHYKSYTVRRYDGIYTALGELGHMEYFDGPFIIQHGTMGTIDIIRNGIGGNTVKRAYNRITDFTGVLVNGEKSDITIMMFGINDALQSDPAKYVTPYVFKKQYKELINTIKTLDPQTTIILMTPTTNGPLTEYCHKISELAQEEGLFLVDQNKLWSEHYCKDAPNYGHGNWLSNIPGDSCHPTPLGAYKIAEYMYHCIFSNI